MATPSISILVCGKTGVGKSSLINYILGENKCEIGCPARYVNDSQRAFRPQTSVVEGISLVLNGVRVTVYDSPGLQDGIKNDDGTNNDEKYLNDMHRQCSDVDLVIYCHDLPECRWTDPEINSIKLITKKFGGGVWDKTVLVFTKANMVQPTGVNDDPKKYLEDYAEAAKKKFRSELNTVLGKDQPDSDTNYADNPPAVLAGSERKQILPTGPFIGPLWISCLNQLHAAHKVNAFISATNSLSRIVSQRDIITQKDDKSGSDSASGASGKLFNLTMEDLEQAWKVMAERRKRLIHQRSINNARELQYPIFIDAERQLQLEMIADSVSKQGAESGEMMIDYIKLLLQETAK